LWRYHSTNALGCLEYLELSESLGVEPVFVINVGMSHKVVNEAAAAYNAELRLSGTKSVEPELTRTTLASADPTGEDSHNQPTMVAPVMERLPIAGVSKLRVLPGNSVNVFRLKVKP
jgi:alpha-L-arabinofuranosidase